MLKYIKSERPLKIIAINPSCIEEEWHNFKHVSAIRKLVVARICLKEILNLTITK